MNRTQFAKAFSANIHDEAHDNNLCHGTYAYVKYQRSYNVPYEIKRQVLNDDLYDY